MVSVADYNACVVRGLVGGVVLICVRMVGFMFKKKHVLSLLLLVEGGYLGVLCLMASVFGVGDPTPMLILLVMVVCEAGVVLAAVVKIVRTHGNDYVRRLRVFKC